MPRLTLFALLLCSGTTLAQTPAPWANKFFQAKDPPAILVHDFGTTPKGTLLTHKLTITNVYDVPMQIIDVRKSCSCLEAIPPNQVLQPHETAELVLTMNADKFTGANAQTFFVTFGPQYVSTAVIQLKATSRADVQMTPGQVNFGVVATGSRPSQTVSIRYQGKQKDWKVTGIAPTTGPYDVMLSEAGNGEHRVTVTLKGDAAGTLNDNLSLTTNDPSGPILQLGVAGVVQAAVSASPNKLRFEDVKVGSTTTQKVVVRATKPFRIQPIAEGADGLSVESFPAAGPVQIITVKFAPTVAGAVKREIAIPTDLGTATISVEAVAVP